jgi:hypothetical protein
LQWQAGDGLLISDCEHPGVVAACQELARREGLTISVLPVLALGCQSSAEGLDQAVLDALDQSLTPRTRMVVLSHLLWNTGAVMPIPRVAERLQAHGRQPWLLVDAAQSMGSLAVAEAAAAADTYAFTGHKWLCGPEGLGGVALSERLLDQAQPTLIGWRSLRHEGSAGSAWHGDARRFEVATSCVPLLAGLAEFHGFAGRRRQPWGAVGPDSGAQRPALAGAPGDCRPGALLQESGRRRRGWSVSSSPAVAPLPLRRLLPGLGSRPSGCAASMIPIACGPAPTSPQRLGR